VAGCLAVGQVVVESKNDSRLWVEILDIDPAQYRALCKKAERIVSATAVPKRPPEADESYSAVRYWLAREGDR
jgi:hypothetical protein